MNLLDGTMEADGFRMVDGSLLPAPLGGAANSAKLAYGIRPEHISVAEDGIPAIVQVIEPTGAEIQIFATVGSQPISAVIRERIAANPGDRIGLRFDLSKVHLFEAGTGRRI
jgi:multiple sugar transport system ATP-binding protein